MANNGPYLVYLCAMVFMNEVIQYWASPEQVCQYEDNSNPLLSPEFVEKLKSV